MGSRRAGPVWFRGGRQFDQDAMFVDVRTRWSLRPQQWLPHPMLRTRLDPKELRNVLDIASRYGLPKVQSSSIEQALILVDARVSLLHLSTILFS